MVREGGGALHSMVCGRFLSGGIILGSPLSCIDLFLYTITLSAVSRDAPAILSYTTLKMASRVLLSSKKPAYVLFIAYLRVTFGNRATKMNLSRQICPDVLTKAVKEKLTIYFR